MISFRHLLGTAALASTVSATPSDPFDWFGVSIPGQTALHRSDAGMLGEDENPSPLVDRAATGGSYTGMTLSYQTDRTPSGAPDWNRPVADFGIETVIEAMPGLVFGLDATDHHPKTILADTSGEWQLFDPQGGLRLGGALDILRKWRAKDDEGLSWIAGGWIPVFSHAREWEARTGIVWTRRLRLDFSAAWSDPAIPARWQAGPDTSASVDTIWWRADKFRWTARLGGSPSKGVSLQAWLGRRELTDPGRGGEPSWRTWGTSDFLGAQCGFRTGPVAWDLEGRVESGSQSVLFDGSHIFGNRTDSGTYSASVGHVGGSGRIGASLELAESVKLAVRADGAWLDLEDADESGIAPAPIPSCTGTWSTAKRFSAIAAPSIRIKVVELTPSAGIQLRIRRGAVLPVWQSLAPVSSGRIWSAPFGFSIARKGSMGGLASYTLSGEFGISGEGAPEAGLRHAFVLSQGF